MTLAAIAVLGCWAAIWIRMLFYSGLYALYLSILGGPHLIGLTQAFLALLMSYFFSKQFNAFAFVVVNYTRLTRFRHRA